MPGVPDELVMRRVEDTVKRHGELDGAEARRDMAAGLLHALDGELADLAAELEQLFAMEQPKVAWLLNSIEHRHPRDTSRDVRSF